VVAGWLARAPGGGLALRWDSRNPSSGVVWVTAEAAGSPPELHEGWALAAAGLLPPLKRNALLALQVRPRAAGCQCLMHVTQGLWQISCASPSAGRSRPDA